VVEKNTAGGGGTLVDGGDVTHWIVECRLSIVEKTFSTINVQQSTIKTFNAMSALQGV
jgi:hypothetical protein